MTTTKTRSTNGKPQTADSSTVAEAAPKKSRRSRSDRQPQKATETIAQAGLQLAIAQGKLHEALAFVKAAVPTKPLHPVLANVLLVADQEQQQVTLTTSDMAIILSASCEATVQRSGAITLPAEILSAVVSRCPMGLLAIDTTQTEEIYSATLSDEQGGITEIRGMSAEEFPEVAADRTKRIFLVGEDDHPSKQDARTLFSQLQATGSLDRDDQVLPIKLWFN